MAHWKDDHSRMCKDTFPIGPNLLVVNFVENNTVQLQNKIQSQYHHSDKVNTMVHITYIHGEYIEDNRVILKEYNFYISDESVTTWDFVQHNFELFYNHLKNNNI